MRSRVPRSPGKALAAGATAALLGLSMAGSAAAAGPKAGLFSPSGGTPIPTSTSCTGFVPVPAQGCAMAGYQASGRDFRYAQAVITVPDHQGVVSACPPGADCEAGPPQLRTPAARSADGPVPAEADPQIYVRPGQTPGSTGRQPVRPGRGAALHRRRPLRQQRVGGVRAGRGRGQRATKRDPAAVLSPIAAADEGDGVFVSVYLEPAGQSVHTVITLPDGSTFNNTFAVTGRGLPRAQAVADWTTATVKPQPVAPSPAKVRDAQFLEGRFTTLNGQQGTFAGPWALNAFEGTAQRRAAAGRDAGRPAELPVERRARTSMACSATRSASGGSRSDPAVPVLTRRPPAGQARRTACDRLLDLLAAAAGIWAAVALVLAVLLALAVTAAFVLLVWFAVA